MELSAEAATPKDLFEALAQQLFERLADQNDVGQALRERVMVDAADMDSLFREGLQALLALTADQKMVFGQATVAELKTLPNGFFSLQLNALGELIDTQRHVFHLAASDLRITTVQISKTPSGFKAIVRLGSGSPKQ